MSKKIKGTEAYERQLQANARWRARNPGRTEKAVANWKTANPLRYMLSRAKASAKRRGLVFDLTEVDFEQPLPTHCPILGLTLIYGASGHISATDPRLASLDRRDNSAGYIRGNVLIVSLRANQLKRDATAEELRLLADFYGRLE